MTERLRKAIERVLDFYLSSRMEDCYQGVIMENDQDDYEEIGDVFTELEEAYNEETEG